MKTLRMTEKDLKIVFLGTPEFAVASLDRLVTEGFNVAAVVTMPDKIAGRGHKTIQSAVKQYAVAHALPVLQPEKLKDPAFLDELRQIDADLFVVIAFRMLPEAVWQMPRLGTFNLHASLLPRYRGAAPINWAVINGDTETGVTTFFLKHDIDTGDILRQERIEILPVDTAGSVHDRLMALGADVTLETVREIVAGTVRPMPQSELEVKPGKEAAPKIFRDTCRIDWSQPALKIHNFVRGLSPYPAAWTTLVHGDRRIEMKVIATAIPDRSVSVPVYTPGDLFAKDGRMFVATLTSPVEIVSLKPEGKKLMGASEFMRGTDVSGDRFDY